MTTSSITSSALLLSTPTSSVPLSPPQITSNDHGPAIIIAAGITLGSAIMTLLLRMYQRWPWSSIKLEDAFLILATIVNIANVAAIALAVQSGLGRRAANMTMDQLHRTKQALVASFAVTHLTEGLSAVSFVLLLRSMNPQKRYRQFLYGLSTAIAAWSVAGIARFAASASDAVSDPGKASWIGFGVVGCLIQLSLMGSAMWTIWMLQMATSKKMGLSLWFSVCLPVVAVIVIRLVYTPAQTFGANFTWADTNMVIILLIESNLTIINAAYPSVRSFLNKVSTGQLVAEFAKDSKSGSRTATYALQSIGGGVRSRSIGAKDRDPTLRLDHRTFAHKTTAVKGDMKSDRSFGSEVIMVRRSVEIIPDERSLADS